MSDAVELHQAFSWTCPDCGRDQFARTVTLSREETEEFCRDEGIVLERGEGLSLVMAPKAVTCGDCGGTFEAEDNGGIAG